MAADVTRTLAIKVIGDTKPLQKGLGKLGKIAAGAAVGGLIAVSYAAIEGVKAFRAEQTIVKAFTRTVKNMGLPVAAATRVMDRMATRAVNLGFDDAETIQGMQTFLKLTGDIDKAASLTALAFDIARSKGIDLAAAQKIAAGVFKGSARALKDYGIEGVAGMEAVRKAAAKERKQAETWARNHPFEVGIGKIGDAWADLVGNLGNADFEGASEALGKLGTAIQRTLFGTTFSSGRHTPGLIDKIGDWGKALGAELLAGIGKVDWGKTLSDTLSTAMGALATFIESGDAVNVAAVGAAIAGAMFLAPKFLAAAKLMLAAPGWLIGGAVDLAARAVGTALGKALAGSMWLASRFISAAKLVFGAAAFLVGGAVDIAARVVGKTLGRAVAGSMWLVSRFADAATGLLGRLLLNEKLLAAATALGSGVGVKLAAGIVSGITLYGPIQDFINKFLPKSPFDEWMQNNKGHAFGTAGSPGGLRWVGERGPELVNLRPGTQVLNSRASMAAGGGSTVVVPITVNAAVGADGARVGREIATYLDQFFARGGRFRYRPVGG